MPGTMWEEAFLAGTGARRLGCPLGVCYDSPLAGLAYLGARKTKQEKQAQKVLKQAEKEAEKEVAQKEKAAAQAQREAERAAAQAAQKAKQQENQWRNQQSQLSRVCGNQGGSWKGQAGMGSREMWGCTFAFPDGTVALETTVPGIQATGKRLRQATKAVAAPPAAAKPARPTRPTKTEKVEDRAYKQWQNQQAQLQKVCGNQGGAWKGQGAPGSTEPWGCTFLDINGSPIVATTAASIRNTKARIQRDYQRQRQTGLAQERALAQIRTACARAGGRATNGSCAFVTPTGEVVVSTVKDIQNQARQAKLRERQAAQAERQAIRDARQAEQKAKREAAQAKRQAKVAERKEGREARVEERQAKREQKRHEKDAKKAENEAKRLENQARRKCKRQGGTWNAETGECIIPERIVTVDTAADVVTRKKCRRMGGTWNRATKQCLMPSGNVIEIPPPTADELYEPPPSDQITTGQGTTDIEVSVTVEDGGAGAGGAGGGGAGGGGITNLEPLESILTAGGGGGLITTLDEGYGPGMSEEEIAAAKEAGLLGMLRECTSEFNAALPLTYADAYGLMDVLAVVCGPAAGTQEQMPAPGSIEAQFGLQPVGAVEAAAVSEIIGPEESYI